MKRVLVATLLAAVSATGANAAITITRVGDAYARTASGTYIYPSNTDVRWLNYLNSSAEQSQVSGTGYLFINPSVQGDTPLGAEPAPGRDDPRNRYLSVLGGGSATFTLTAAQQGINSFFVDLGSIDDYNDLTITFGGTSQSFSGTDIMMLAGLSGSANGDQVSSSTNGRFLFTGVAGITSITFASGSNSFEVDNIAGAVPEPATWAMMIGGFGLVGGAMRRRNRNVSYA